MGVGIAETGPDYAGSYAGQVKCPEVGLRRQDQEGLAAKRRKSRKARAFLSADRSGPNLDRKDGPRDWIKFVEPGFGQEDRNLIGRNPCYAQKLRRAGKEQESQKGSHSAVNETGQGDFNRPERETGLSLYSLDSGGKPGD